MERALGGVVRAYGETRKVDSPRGGAGRRGRRTTPPIALGAGADAYVTGEMAYHAALDRAVDEGLCVLEAGHAATENAGGARAVRRLYKTPTNAVQYNMWRLLRAAHRAVLVDYRRNARCSWMTLWQFMQVDMEADQL